MKKSSMFLMCMTLIIGVFAQDLDYAKSVLNQLTSEDFYGRGYVKQGDRLAAEFIAAEFEKHGLSTLGESYFQDYEFPINTFPGKITVKLDGTKLIPGKDYVIASSNPGIKGKFNLHYLPDEINSEETLITYLQSNEVGDAFLVSKQDFRKTYGKEIAGIKGFILLTEKTPYWHVSRAEQVKNTFWMKIREDKLAAKPEMIAVKAQNEFFESYPTQNVIGFIEGKKVANRFVVFSAHYDHLGMMGKDCLYPGANDNGSGTSMLLDLARHYAQPENQPDFSFVFMAFSGEEAGLHGSSYYVENPLFRLEGIQLLINLDMVGSGSEGITVVNSLAYKSLYDKMVSINEENNYLANIKQRGEACNSDHCPFYNKGVKSIFIYTMGPEHLEYHTLDDSAEKLPFTAYRGLFKLLTEYVATID